MKKVDKNFCMSSYLTFRYVEDRDILFMDRGERRDARDYSLYNENLNLCANWQDLDLAFQKAFKSVDGTKIGLMLSGGMDSAILAAYMPKGSKTYTFRSNIEGTIDETEPAKKYCEYYGLEHNPVEVSWEDMLENARICMAHKNAPVHSIEPQLYKAAQQAKADGIEVLIVGESADTIFGGMDQLLSKDWSYQDWVSRYTYVEPSMVLKDPVSMDYLYEKYKIDPNGVDFVRFVNEVFYVEGLGSYLNSFGAAGINILAPYAQCRMSEKLDLERVRNGESKYLVRELYAEKYPDFPVPTKIPMPRAVNQWLADWKGPQRPEFLPNCIEGLTGDQKWLIFCLEMFLNQNNL